VHSTKWLGRKSFLSLWRRLGLCEELQHPVLHAVWYKGMQKQARIQKKQQRLVRGMTSSSYPERWKGIEVCPSLSLKENHIGHLPVLISFAQLLWLNYHIVIWRTKMFSFYVVHFMVQTGTGKG
jgi:hypothetical protein